LLVDTEGLVLKAKVHSAKVPDQDGIKLVLEGAHDRLPRLSRLWVDAGYQGRGKEWAQKALGLSVEVVHRTPKPTPEKTARIWAEEWSKEGWQIDWQRLLPQRGIEVLPRRSDSRAYLLVAFSEPQDEQGLREVVYHWGGVHLCSDESFDGEALSSLMSLSDSFRRVLLGHPYTALRLLCVKSGAKGRCAPK
jgi:hypothetical protein